MNRQQLLNRLDTAWVAFQASYAGLSNSRLTEPGVTGDWSVKDLIAHVTWWEEEALRHLPLIIVGDRPPRYSVAYGGIDAFNAMMAERKRDVSLSEVLTQQDDTHQRLIDFVQSVSERPFHAGDALPTSPTTRYLQPLPDPHQGDTGMAAAAISSGRRQQLPERG